MTTYQAAKSMTKVISQSCDESQLAIACQGEINPLKDCRVLMDA